MDERPNKEKSAVKCSVPALPLSTKGKAMQELLSRVFAGMGSVRSF